MCRNQWLFCCVFHHIQSTVLLNFNDNTECWMCCNWNMQWNNSIIFVFYTWLSLILSSAHSPGEETSFREDLLRRGSWVCSCTAKSLQCHWLPHSEGALTPGREVVWKKSVRGQSKRVEMKGLVVTWYHHYVRGRQRKRWRRNLSSHLRALNIL